MPAKKLPERERIERQRIGRTIRAIREAKQLSADQVANRVSKTQSFSRPFLANIEAGRRGLPRQILAPLAAALEVDEGAIVHEGYYDEAEDDGEADAA